MFLKKMYEKQADGADFVFDLQNIRLSGKMGNNCDVSIWLLTV